MYLINVVARCAERTQKGEAILVSASRKRTTGTDTCAYNAYTSCRIRRKTRAFRAATGLPVDSGKAVSAISGNVAGG